MSDQPEAPPPKKIGSLRDRIAAFEKAGAGSAAPAPAPAPRPKPAGFASWKPRPPSPTSPAPVETSESASSAKSSGMSTADAKESIVKGGSLKERMAALQGKGAFGGPPPVAPKPPLEKPKWKPPPAVAPPSDDEDGDQPRAVRPDLGDIIKSPPSKPPISTDDNEEKATEDPQAEPSAAAEGEEVSAEADPEEEERQRRAAIAARMARLGGTRVGMAPPVFGKRPPPPPKKRSSVSEDVATSTSTESVTSPKPQASEPESRKSIDSTEAASPPAREAVESPPIHTEEPAPRRLSEAGSLASVEPPEPQAQSSRSPPVSMPVPAAPRRAAPPRKKPSKPTAPPPPVPEVEVEPTGEKEETSPPAVPAVEQAEAAEREGAVAPPVEALLTPLPPTKAVEEAPATVIQNDEVLESKAAASVEEDVKEETASPDAPTAERDSASKQEGEEPEVREEAEAEVDEETRRRQVAERIARMGGINPFAAHPPRRQSSKVTEESDPVAESQESGPLAPHAAESEAALEVPAPKPQEPPAVVDSPPPLPPSKVEMPEEPLLQGQESVDVEDSNIAPAPPQIPSPDLTRKAESMTKEQNDDDSEYSDEETDDVGHPAAAFRADGGPTEVEESKPVGTVAPNRNIPHPPHPVSDPEDDVDSNEEDEMIRSQILAPPPGTDSGKRDNTHSPADSVPHVVDSIGGRKVPLESQSQSTLSDSDEESDQEPSPLDSPAPPAFLPPPPPPRAGGHPPPINRSLPPTPAAPAPQAPPPAVPAAAHQDTLKVPSSSVEILDEDEGDPIDPSFHSPSRRTSVILPSSNPDTPPVIGTPATEDAPAPSESKSHAESAEDPAEDAEAARRRTIAERMAKLGGIKFGAAPTVPGARPKQSPQVGQEEQATTDGPKEPEQQAETTEEEEERARKERIAAKLAGMGGMRIGMMPASFPPRKSHVLTEPAPTSPPPPPPPARVPPPPQAQDSESELDGSVTSDDIVKVEAEESDLEEVRREDIEEETPPPIPSRAVRQSRRESAEVTSSPPLNPSSPPRRPPVPAGLPVRRPSTQTVTSQRRTSGDVATSPPPPQRRPSLPKQQSEYVMVEEPSEEAPPLPPQRPPGRRTSTGPPTRSPPLEPQESLSLSSQWELPTIPTSTLEFGNDDLSMSWTEAEAPRAEESITPSASTVPQHPPTQKSRSANDAQLSGEDLITLWGRVGVQVCEAATTLYERSKKGLIGDGTYPGFVRAVVHEVPNAVLTDDYGYLIYKQVGASVQKRASDIMPGDLVELHDAKFKGHKGLQAYHQSVGADGEPVLGVVSEFEPKKSKVRVFQANQHVGQQTVEAVSYRLDDMKSGTLKVYRIIEA